MAEQMLSELKDILDRLQTGTFSDNAKQQRAAKMMKDLNDLVSKQQKLLDDTFKAKREQGGGKAGRQFNVSPPGQPMEFGNGIYMEPFGTPQEEGQDDGISRRATRTRKGARRPQPAAGPASSNGPARPASSTIWPSSKAICATSCKA